MSETHYEKLVRELEAIASRSKSIPSQMCGEASAAIKKLLTEGGMKEAVEEAVKAEVAKVPKTQTQKHLDTIKTGPAALPPGYEQYKTYFEPVPLMQFRWPDGSLVPVDPTSR